MGCFCWLSVYIESRLVCGLVGWLIGWFSQTKFDLLVNLLIIAVGRLVG